VQDNWPEIWKSIKGVFQQVREIITTASGVITRIIKTVVKTVMFIWDNFGDEILATMKATWRLVTGVIKAAWKVISGVVRGAIDVVHGIIKTAMSLIRGDWGKAWEGIKQIFAGVWKAIKGVVKGAVDYVKTIIRGGVDAIKVAWSGLGKIVTFLRDKVSTPIKAVFGGVRDRVVEIVRAVVDKVRTAWSGLTKIVDFMREKIRDPLLNVVNGLKTALGNIFEGAVNAVKKAWDTLTGVVKTPINVVIGFYNDGIRWVWNKVIAKIPGVGELGPIEKLAKGGHVPGSGDRDTVPALLTPGEFVVTKKAAKAWGPKVLAALNETSGTIDPGVFGYAAGGYARSVDEAKAFALSHKGKPYIFPDVGPNSFDCSGFTSALVNYILGKDPPWFRRHSTGSMGADSALAAGDGGSGSGFVLGVKPPYQTNQQGVLVGHMAGTIGGDLNVEGTPPAMRVGAGAKGASSFATKYHLPGYAGLSDADTGIAKLVGSLKNLAMSGLNPPLGDLLEKLINQLPGKMFDFFAKKLPSLLWNAAKEFVTGSISLSPEMLAKIQGYANGGRVRRDGPILVGERGPELYWGKQGDRVQPLNRAGADAGGVHVNQIVAADPEAALAVLRREEWRRRAIPVAA
ncbi:MAG: hypothetical protein M3Q75_00220, partial [Gemmatimonadota bacterium]|nr:hypothetical protein [Gemmatimonadota bacterium]